MLSFKYEQNPHEIEAQSFKQIRELTDLSRFSKDEAQIAMRLVHTCGEPAVAEHAYFSDNAIPAGLAALATDSALLCDVEMVRHGLTKRMLKKTPLCFLNDDDIPGLAKQKGETRTMAALSKWPEFLEDSIVLIGNAPTALFRLLEMIDQGAPKPSLVIGMPVGFIGAAEAKDALIKHHKTLGFECMTIQGRQGGSALTAGSFNMLLRLQRECYF
ncbi:MAG: precorrin-8X methylmutase [Methylococcales bacterium]|jgi:precorrin-8X/cobalt-precorrin-8 methylmutase|nr:precorrin-8X methylmutase [Methylococcales bacterium]